jgi:glycerol uptake facilitator protein
MKGGLLGQLVAEFLGTMMLITLGDGVVAMVVLFGKGIPGEIVMGGYTNITIGWGLAVLFGICIAGRISGAHLNPAVTLASAVFRGFSWGKVGPYVLAQVAGAFVGAALVFANYKPAIEKFDHNLSKPESVGVFATSTPFPEQWWFGAIDQVIGTALLVGLIFAIVDPRNQFAAPPLHPLMIGLVVVAIGVSWGGMHGYAINPARDFGPRLFTKVAGFQQSGLNGDSWLFLIPIVGPLLGGLAGAAIYDFLIRPFLPPAENA